MQIPGGTTRRVASYRRVLVGRVVLACACLAGLAMIVSPARAATANSVLILYDAPPPLAWLGELHAAHLANLLGHFNLTVTSRPVESYAAGEMGQHRMTFYIGSVFDNPLPAAFRSDVLSQQYDLCWMKYNLWQIAWRTRDYRTPEPPQAAFAPLPTAAGVPRPVSQGAPPAPAGTGAAPRPVAQTQFGPDPQFESQFGFRFQGLNQSGFPVVRYRNEDFTRDLRDPEIGEVIVHDPARVATFGQLRQPSTGASAPYVLASGSLWYVSDIPFSFVTETDRYLVFADVLHDIVGLVHQALPRALVRLEDIDPVLPPEFLAAVRQYLEAEGIPYGVSVVPVYTDPTGFYNDGVAESVLIRDAEVLPELKAAAAQGAPLFLHGYTHQYQSTFNPITAVSGDDFEFFRVTLNSDLTLAYHGPVSEDSANWARGRLREGKRELQRAGLGATGWETPHYAASQTDYQVFAQDFALVWERSLYFSAPLSTTGAQVEAARWAATARPMGRLEGSAEAPMVAPFGTTAATASEPARAFAGQFFPYPIQRDVYGRQALPENLGHIDPVGWLAFPPRFPADLLEAARRNRALREPWAGFFFHPYLDLALLQEVVAGLRALGYEFVSPTQVFTAGGGESEPTAAGPATPNRLESRGLAPGVE